jgi:hypothetical protein
LAATIKGNILVESIKVKQSKVVIMGIQGPSLAKESRFDLGTTGELHTHQGRIKDTVKIKPAAYTKYLNFNLGIS